MGPMLTALLNLQSIERQLAHVRGRLKTRKNAVAAQEKRIEQLRADHEAAQRKATDRRKDADRIELDLKTKEEQVNKFRTALNAAKTNKDYAAILTQINTIKADNAKIEDQVLRVMQEVESLKAEADKVKADLEAQVKRLDEIKSHSQAEIAKLTAMFDDLSAQRATAAQAVPQQALDVFERIAGANEGDAMAAIEVHGRKPPFDYICGGCYMSLNAEHANALRVRDEIRRCDNCKRILYLDIKPEQS